MLQKQDSKFSASIDCWSSPHRLDPYLGVTIQWISNDWTLECLTLSLAELEGEHSGENLCEEFTKIFE